MDNQNNKKQKKKGSGLWAILFFVVIWAINHIDFDRLSYRFSRLFRGGSLSMDDMVIVVGIVAVLAFVLLIVTITRAKKVRAAKRFDGIRSVGGGTAKAHSHDRVTGYSVGAENPQEHWKKQLDGFLAAGIIDRSEYRVLLERRLR